jgi:hypothetical protein
MENYSYKSFINCSMLDDLNNIVIESKCYLEGNCLYKHLTNFAEYEGFEWENKDILRKNLFKVAKRCKNGLEIGFNAGHSAAIYFNANPLLKLLTFDICQHEYTLPCVLELVNKYNCNILLIIGDSLETLRDYQVTHKYDFIHIDGSHGVDLFESDLINSKKFAHEKTYVIIDDINIPHIENIVGKYIYKGEIVEIDYDKENLEKNYFHRIYHYVV